MPYGITSALFMNRESGLAVLAMPEVESSNSSDLRLGTNVLEGDPGRSSVLRHTICAWEHLSHGGLKTVGRIFPSFSLKEEPYSLSLTFVKN